MPARFALVTTNHNDYLCANALASLRAAAARWGAEYVELRLPPGADYFASAERSLFLARPQPWDRVFVIDGDCLVHHAAPSPFDRDPDVFWAVPDLYPGRWDPECYPVWRADIHERWVDRVHARFAFGVEPVAVLTEFVNAGVFVAAPATHSLVFKLFAELFDRSALDDRRHGHYEQALLNYCLHATGTPIGHLGEEWNTIGPPDGPMAAHVYHFTGPGRDEVRRRLPHFDWRSGPGPC